MAFPSTYDPSEGVCTAYAATDGGVFVNNTATPGVPCRPNSGWVQAQSGLHVAFSGTIAGVSQQPSAISSVAVFNGTLTVTTAGNSNFVAGQTIQFGNMVHATFLNARQNTLTGVSGTTLIFANTLYPFYPSTAEDPVGIPPPTASNLIGPTLYLPTGDDDVWVSTSGGLSWSSFFMDLGDAGQTYIDPALPTREVSSRGGGTCQIAVTVSADRINPPSSSNVTNAGAKCFGPVNEWSGIQPPNMSALSQVMMLASDAPLSEGYYMTVQSPFRNKACLFSPCRDKIMQSTQQDHPSYWSDVSLFFGPGQVGGIATSGGVTTPIVYVVTANDGAAAYQAGAKVQAGQVWKGTLSNGKVADSDWTLASTGLNQARGLFVNPYNANELYVTDIGDGKIKTSIDGGQHWLPQSVLTDIASNHGEFVFGCDTVPFGDTCSLSGMAFDRKTPGVRVAAMYPGGLAFSRDGGVHWMELDVTNNVPRPCWLGPCSLVWDLIEYPMSVFYDSNPINTRGDTSIYVALVGKSVKRVDGPFATLQFFSLAYCPTCAKHLALRGSVPTKVFAVVDSTGAIFPLVRDSRGLFRGQFLFDSRRASTLAFHLLVNNEPTPQFKHELSANEIYSGVAACGPPMLGLTLNRNTISPVDGKFVPIAAEIVTSSECGGTIDVKLESITGTEPLDPGDVRGANFGNVWLPKTPSELKTRRFRSFVRSWCDHDELSFRCPFRSGCLQFSNPCRPAGGDPCASPPTRGFPKECAASLALPALRPAVVGFVIAMVARLAS